jgi:hypothetical protein
MRQSYSTTPSGTMCTHHVCDVCDEQSPGNVCRFGGQTDTNATTATRHVLVIDTKVDVTTNTDKTVVPGIVLTDIVYIAMSRVFGCPEVEEDEEAAKLLFIKLSSKM